MSRALLLAEARELARSGEARELRLKARLSLAELAQDVGVHATSVFAWESGRRKPSGDAAVRYAGLLRELASR
jgi:DNA-binding transcriptional regulator YiaG